MSPLLVVSFSFWFFAGICGYIMMYFCDTAAGKGLSITGNFFVLSDQYGSFLAALILAPFAFCVGLVALYEWKKYTRDLRNRFLS